MIAVLFSPLLAAGPAPSCSARQLAPGAAVELVGSFTDMRYTADHAYGYSVQLWRSGRCVFGLFMASQGLAGDTPAGELEAVRYDPATGSISFHARLTEGRFSNREYHDVPSRDSYRFSGLLDRRGISGTLVHINALTPGARATTARIRLRRSAAEEQVAIHTATAGEWLRKADEVLRRRGPRW